jgi:hypothetical protein
MKKFSKIYETKEKILDDNIANGNVITKKGIFKDESVHIEIDKLELKIEILVEKGYGED